MKQKKIQKMNTQEVADLAITLLETLSERMESEGWDYGNAFHNSFLVRQIQGLAEGMRSLSNRQLLRGQQELAQLASASAIQPRDRFAD